MAHAATPKSVVVLIERRYLKAVKKGEKIYIVEVYARRYGVKRSRFFEIVTEFKERRKQTSDRRSSPRHGRERRRAPGSWTRKLGPRHCQRGRDRLH